MYGLLYTSRRTFLPRRHRKYRRISDIGQIFSAKYGPARAREARQKIEVVRVSLRINIPRAVRLLRRGTRRSPVALACLNQSRLIPMVWLHRVIGPVPRMAAMLIPTSVRPSSYSSAPEYSCPLRWWRVVGNFLQARIIRGPSTDISFAYLVRPDISPLRDSGSRLR